MSQTAPIRPITARAQIERPGRDADARAEDIERGAGAAEGQTSMREARAHSTSRDRPMSRSVMRERLVRVVRVVAVVGPARSAQPSPHRPTHEAAIAPCSFQMPYVVRPAPTANGQIGRQMGVGQVRRPNMALASCA